jgi:hypothetical protein
MPESLPFSTVCLQFVMMYSLTQQSQAENLREFELGPCPPLPMALVADRKLQPNHPAKSLLTKWFSCVILVKTAISNQRSAVSQKWE